MRTVGHRGASALGPENTLLAIRLAIMHRLDYAEVDVRLSRDEQLVVHHDAHFVATDGVRAPVDTLSAAELASVPKGEGQVIPTLEQVLALADGRIGVYVELKAPGTGEAFGALLRRLRPVPELIGGSFSPDLVGELRRAAPQVPRSVLFNRVSPSTMIEACRALGARYAHPCTRPITRAATTRLHGAGLEVMAPHTNDSAEAERFLQAGADFISSDDPRLLVAIRERIGLGAV
jgi:glycerophosphoryl diester phosphodiesterase